MPQIREFRGGVSPRIQLNTRTVNPNELAGGGEADLGQGLQQAGSRLAEARRFLNSQAAAAEVTKNDMEFIRLRAELGVELQNTLKNWKPEDGEIVPGFQERVRERLEATAFRGDGTSIHNTSVGRQHYEKRAAELSAHFLTEATQSQSVLMGNQVIIDHNETLDRVANQLQQNPDTFDVYEHDFQQMVMNPDGRYAALPEQKKQSLLRSSVNAMAKAAVQGKIREAPRVALNGLETGWMTDKLDNKDTPVLINAAKTAVHALEIDEDRAYREAERQRVAKARSISNKLLTKLAAHDADPTNPPLTAQDLIDSGLGEVDDNGFQSLISVLHTRSKEGGTDKIRTDPATFINLFNRIHANSGDPKKLTDELAIQDAFGKQQRLSYADMVHLRKEFQESRTPDGARLSEVKKNHLDLIKTQITKSNMLLGKLDQDGDYMMLLYTLDVNKRIEDARKAGKDPHTLFDPSHADFVGKPEILSRYQKSTQQSIKSISQKLREGKNSVAPLPPEHMRKQGESYADWKRRVNP